MEVDDGFIVSIFNYCDRWCERCPLTSRCRLFADSAEHEAACDPSLKALIEAPPLPQHRPDPPPWMAKMIDGINAEVAKALAALPAKPSTDDLNGGLDEPYAAISTRAREYAFRVDDWWRKTQGDAWPAPDDPRSVILWFSTLNSAKVFRALHGLVEFDGDRERHPDHEGSAKVALIGIDRSMVAWQDLVATSLVTQADATPFLHELSWLRQVLERLIPRARAFVRPGFDEPDEVSRLEAAER